ncbi:MAG: hypothetical protein KIT84_08120 [Labilithrix sp.]|nr:hypothetical protein [Labilithrix sp.]MCW5810963.1 hypothetical protein [Labilithrix sp.]
MSNVSIRITLTDISHEPRVVLARYWLDLEAARRAIARGRPSAIAHTARGLLTALGSIRVRVEMEHAAAAFAEGLDARSDAEEWVSFAVSARAALESARKSGADLEDELAMVDASLENAREAVLLLNPEDYKDALAATPPDKTAWWGERARLDAGLREIDLERALGDLADRRY